MRGLSMNSTDKLIIKAVEANLTRNKFVFEHLYQIEKLTKYDIHEILDIFLLLNVHAVIETFNVLDLCHSDILEAPSLNASQFSKEIKSRIKLELHRNELN